MNPPKPSSQAINASITPLTSVDLSVDPHTWLPNRLKHIENYAKRHKQPILKDNNQQQIDQNIADIRTQIENEFEKVLGHRPQYMPIKTSNIPSNSSSVINTRFSSHSNSEQFHLETASASTGLLNVNVQSYNESNPPKRSININQKNSNRNEYNPDFVRQSVVNLNNNIERILKDSKESETKKNSMEWIRYYSEQSKLYYFYHISTNSIHWSLPSNDTLFTDWNAYESANNEHKGFKILCIYDSECMQYTFTNEQTGTIIAKKEAYNNLWIKHLNKKNNSVYFENTATQKMQNEEPTYPYIWSKSSGNSRDF